MLEWTELRFFLAVHREGTLSGAARLTGVAQTTVGRRLNALEAELSAKLFRRTNSGFVITDVGRSILEAAEAMEASAVAIERRAAGDDARVEGLLRIATTEAFARSHVVSRVVGLCRLYPNLQVQILASNQPADLEHEADLAVRLMRPTTPSLIGRKVSEIDIALFASQSYLATHGPIDLEDELEGHEVIGYAGSMAASAEAKWLEEHAANASMPLCTNSIPALARAVADGLVLGIVPRLLARENELIEVAPLDDVPARPVWLVFHRDLKDDARIRAVIRSFVD